MAKTKSKKIRTSVTLQPIRIKNAKNLGRVCAKNTGDPKYNDLSTMVELLLALGEKELSKQLNTPLT